MRAKRVFILGSTGTIGINTLKVIERFPQMFKVEGLTAYNNIELLSTQIKKFQPRYVATGPAGYQRLQKEFRGKGVKVFDVQKDLEHLVSLKSVDIVVIGMRGSAALFPFLAAVRSGKTVAPANKEALVIAGDILMREAKKSGAQVIPVDSEQSAIFQCLQGQNRAQLKKVYLTASGGALRNIAQSQFDRLSVADILNHPRWKMGKKITVDSATLMNKGFEVIEAMRLFSLTINQIEVIVHPEAIIHSMVEFQDGSLIAQLGITDMRLPIQYALTFPQRLKTNLPPMDFIKLGQLNFEKPDFKKFPSLQLALDVARKGGTFPSVLNAADEEAVDAYLQGKIRFTQIYAVVEKIIRKHRVALNPSLKEILGADQWAREEARGIMKE